MEQAAVDGRQPTRLLYRVLCSHLLAPAFQSLTMQHPPAAAAATLLLCGCPHVHRVAVPYALMNAAVSFSQVAAGPIAAGLLKLDGLGGLAGWQ